MSDALVSPAVGGALWAASAGLTFRAARRVEASGDDRRVPLMGVLGAFVFAAQMVNFTIPGTGSSGHLGGGLLLAALLGPDAAFLVMASVLTVQALFFADGGLLALGANVVNLGLFTCYLAYPLVFRPLAGRAPGRARLTVAALVSAIGGLALGASAVVAETVASRVSTLPARSFLFLMIPIHLAIGVVEGIVTAAVLLVVWRARPDLAPAAPRPVSRRLLAGFAAVALVAAGALSLVASERPDGLEWSLARVASAEPGRPGPLHAFVARVQARSALLPEYGLRGDPAGPPGPTRPRAGTSLAGVVGAGLTLALAVAAGVVLRVAGRRRARAPR